MRALRRGAAVAQARRGGFRRDSAPLRPGHEERTVKDAEDAKGPEPLGGMHDAPLRLLNNRWGSDERGCDSPQSVCVDADGTLGWEFNRGTCGGEGTQPDYPEIEFGLHPLGIGDELETSPPFSSTALLPLQLQDIDSASIEVDTMNIDLGGAESWNINLELWGSERHPVTAPDPGVFAEAIAFWGWQEGTAGSSFAS